MTFSVTFKGAIWKALGINKTKKTQKKANEPQSWEADEAGIRAGAGAGMCAQQQ